MNGETVCAARANDDLECDQVYSNLHLHDYESADNFANQFIPDLNLGRSDSLCRPDPYPDLDRTWLRYLYKDPLSMAGDCASDAGQWIE